jgi:putative hemolysin
MQHFSYGSVFLDQSRLAAMALPCTLAANENAGTFMPASEYCLQKTSLLKRKTPPSPIESAYAASAFSALTVQKNDEVVCSLTWFKPYYHCSLFVGI